jgi:hypothetical protein
VTLADSLGLKPEDVPLDRAEFRTFANQHVYGGLSKTELERRGIRLKVDSRLEQLVTEFLTASQEQRQLKSKLREFELTPPKDKFPTHLIDTVNEFLNAVAPRLSHSFTRMSSGEFIEAVELSYGDLGDLVIQIRVRLVNGRVCRPGAVLSEANLDLLALLFFVAVAQESAARGQAKVLVLDDVLQSVDATVRVAFLDFLIEELADWQLFITVHDRMWREQVRVLLQRRGHEYTEKEITDWTFHGGPVLRGGESDVATDLVRALENDRPAEIASSSGRLLELACHHLSSNLPVSVKRKRGDQYTLADLWPGVARVLRKTQCVERVAIIDRTIHLRNLVGAHFNEWAQSASLGEVREFGEAVLDFVRTVHCVSCIDWISLVISNPPLWRCRCGSRQLERQSA